MVADFLDGWALEVMVVALERRADILNPVNLCLFKSSSSAVKRCRARQVSQSAFLAVMLNRTPIYLACPMILQPSAAHFRDGETAPQTHIATADMHEPLEREPPPGV